MGEKQIAQGESVSCRVIYIERCILKVGGRLQEKSRKRRQAIEENVVRKAG